MNGENVIFDGSDYGKDVKTVSSYQELIRELEARGDLP